MISRNEKNTHCAIVAWLTATLQMYVQTCIPSHDSRRVTRRHSRRGVLPPRERSYPSISPSVLKSILRIPPHLRSALRPKPGFDEGWESGEGIGKRWEKGENSISGVHIKVGRLVHRDESQHRGWQSGRASESSLCMYVHFDLQPYSSYFFVLFTFFLRRKWDVFHLIAVFFDSTLYGTFRPHIKSTRTRAFQKSVSYK